jgi:hypothetical protein
MPDIFHYVPHPHIAARAASGPTKVRDVATDYHGTTAMGRFNAALGLRITLIVGTMWAAYLFTAVALVSAPSAFKSGNTTVIIAWISSNFIQLALLPIIIVGQNIQARAADKRSQATYDDAVAVLEEAKQIQAHLLAQDREIQKIIETLGGPGGGSPAG